MSLGIERIGSFIPEQKISNFEVREKFDIDADFIENKIGVRMHALKPEGYRASDMCVKAFENLQKTHSLNRDEIECCVVVTQNPDYNIPHTAAIVHGKLNLPETCAAFDISLGCSGYVYALSNIIAFMKANGMKKGLLFTSDQYSDIVDKEDKNTALLFGDAASVTLISDNPIYVPVDFAFGTNGKAYRELICDEHLYMNGRAVFNFTATVAPKHIKALLEKNGLQDEEIKYYYLHQGSKYIVDTIRKRLGASEEKVPFKMAEYGNTISSSIPLMLEDSFESSDLYKVVISGFGVGLSWASGILDKIR